MQCWSAVMAAALAVLSVSQARPSYYDDEERPDDWHLGWVPEWGPVEGFPEIMYPKLLPKHRRYGRSVDKADPVSSEGSDEKANSH